MTQYAAALLASADESNSLRTQKQIRTLRKTELDSLYSEWLQRAPVEGQGAIIAAQGTYMNDLAVQETVLQQQVRQSDCFPAEQRGVCASMRVALRYAP